MSELDGFGMDGCACSWSRVNPASRTMIQYVRKHNPLCLMHGGQIIEGEIAERCTSETIKTHDVTIVDSVDGSRNDDS